jgi:pyruvate/2-oxoglutarate dehydrogenase complex dihydrolipoamide acyltransferase (E2) component
VAISVHVPQWGMGIQECRIVRWLKQEGDAVREDEPIAELETAKAEQELEAPATGVLSRILVPAGELVPVRSVIAIIAEPES